MSTEKKKGSRLQQRAAESHAREKRIDFLLENGKWLGIVAIVVGIVAMAAVNLNESQRVKLLDEVAADELQKVFFGGNPWLVLCADSKNAVMRDGKLRETFTDAAKLLEENKLATTGVMNCSKTLPSGKTVYDRLRLNQTISPVIFLAQGGEKPHQFDKTVLKKPTEKKTKKKPAKKKKSKSQEEEEEEDLEADEVKKTPGHVLYNSVRRRVGERFSLGKISSVSNLNKKCFERKLCALFLSYGTPSKEIQGLVKRTWRSLPLFRWAYIDTSRYQFSAEKELMGGKKFDPKVTRLVVFRSKQFQRFPQIAQQGSVDDMLKFLSIATNEDSAGFEGLKKIPTLTAKRTESRASSTSTRNTGKKENKKKREEKRQTQDENPSTSQSPNTDDEQQQQQSMTPEEARQAQLDRERRSREQMEEQAAQFEPQWELDDEEDEEDDLVEADDEDEVEEIELD